MTSASDPIALPTPPDPETLVRENLHLARVAAAKFAKRHKAIEFDESYSDALLGLWEAARRFDPARSTFESRAEVVMLSRMRDGLRNRNRVRTVRDLIRRTRVPCESLSAPVVDSRGVAVPLYSTIADPKSTPPGESPTPAESLPFLRCLEPRRRRVLVASVIDGLTGPQIAAEIGVTESRVSQMYADAVATLREAYGSPDDPPAPLRPRRYVVSPAKYRGRKRAA